MIVPISAHALDYAKDVRKRIRKAGHHVEVDSTDRKMQKKVREAQLEQFNYILVVGRTRENKRHRQRENER